MQRNKIMIAAAVALTLVSGSAIAATTTTKATTPDWVLPNSTVTPGATNANVNQANIKDNVCKANWTGTVRPPVSYTNKLKATQMASTYKTLVATFGASAANYEEDHLISLQLGGSPTDPKNLWPEPYAGNNARKKDVIETKLKNLICTGKIQLADAQKAIATNWVLAYNKYVTPADAKAPVDANN
jgi:hypothetical protein